MAEYIIVAQILCKCGVWVNLRTVQTTYGGTDSVPCWKCSRTVVLTGTKGYYIDHDGTTHATKCKIISSEVRKK